MFQQIVHKSFSTVKSYINLVGESAADEGGPKREFFRLAMESCLNDPSLFSGPAFSKVPLHNTAALLQRHFKYVGNVLAMSLIQGGPAPICFASWVYEYIANGLERMEINDDELSSDSVKVFLKQVKCHFFGCDNYDNCLLCR